MDHHRHLSEVPQTQSEPNPLADAVIAEVTVQCPASDAFYLFVDTLADWWPLRHYSLADSSEIVAIEVDRRSGGTITEIHRDGSSADRGTFLTWEPPHRFSLNWHVTPGLEQTIVTVTFMALSPATTKVTLVYSGWQGIDPKHFGLQSGYTQGWDQILQCFAEQVS